MQGFTKIVEGDFTTVEATVRSALADRGFGVLTEIDVAATLKAKLGVDRPALKILGACNPSFANRALNIDPSVSLILPCNVVLEVVGDKIKVSAMDPSVLMDSPEMKELALEATELLSGMIDAI